MPEINMLTQWGSFVKKGYMYSLSTAARTVRSNRDTFAPTGGHSTAHNNSCLQTISLLRYFKNITTILSFSLFFSITLAYFFLMVLDCPSCRYITARCPLIAEPQ